MGLFDSICAESGLIICDEQQLIPIIETAKDRWVPLGLPITGTNDRGGTMDVPGTLDDAMKRLVAIGKKLAFKYPVKKVTLESLLDEIRGDGGIATLSGKRVSFSLIDGAVFDAIVGVVKAGGASAWTRYAKLALGDPGPKLPNRQPGSAKKKPSVDATTKRLAKAILDAPDDAGTRKVLLDHLLQREDPHARLLSILPVLGKVDVAELVLSETHAMYSAADRKALKPAMVELARFLAWGTQLLPASGEGQFYGYTPEDPEDDLDGYSKPYSDHAREKYAGMPELLPAIVQNEKAFKERGAD
ncbi:MAG: hypothetical protein H0V17_02570 [Deltaproteobacteria bacterium]|nr:hypothetical protein [Deltaproteobacteria bacterium]